MASFLDELMRSDVSHFLSGHIWTQQLTCSSCIILLDTKLTKSFSYLSELDLLFGLLPSKIMIFTWLK